MGVRSVRAGLVASVAFSIVLGASQRDADQRDKTENVGAVLAALEATTGKVIADVGAGEGFYTIRIAKAVGPTGRVTAVDVDQKALEKLRQQLTADKIGNVDTVLGGIDDPKLANAEYDAVLVYNTYHEMTEHAAMRRAMFAALKPGGRLVVAEGISDNIRTASREVQVKDHEIGPEYVSQELTATGFQVIDTQLGLLPYVNPQRKGGFWLIVARKPT